MASDRATQAYLRRAKSFKALVRQQTWPDMKEQLLDELAPLIDTRNIKGENKAFQVEVRTTVYNTLEKWLNTMETLSSLPEEEPVDNDYTFDLEG